MTVAALLVNLAVAVATAIAAFAAWRAATVTKDDAEARNKPHVAVGTLRLDIPNHSIIVPVKNLGLGPALTVAIRLKAHCKDVTGNVRQGLAPMESFDWKLPAIMWDDELPDVLALEIEGACTDPTGTKKPIYFWGSTDPLPMPSPEPGDDLGEGVDGEAIQRLSIRQDLRVLRNFTRQADFRAYAEGWARFWAKVPRDTREADIERVACEEWDHLEREEGQVFMSRRDVESSGGFEIHWGP